MMFADLAGVVVLAAAGGLGVKYFGDRRRANDSWASLAGAAVTVSFLCVLAVVEGNAPALQALTITPTDGAASSPLVAPPQEVDFLADAHAANACQWPDADPFATETYCGLWPSDGLAAAAPLAEDDCGDDLSKLGLYVPEWMIWHDGSSAGAPAAATDEAPLDPEALARSDSLALLQLARRRYDETVADYTGTLNRRLRGDDGKLGSQESMQCRFRQEPLNIYLKWSKGAGKVDKALYAPSLHGPQLHVHPTGLAGLFASVVKVDLDGKYAETASGITKFGFAGTLDRLIDRGTGARAQGELTENYLGPQEVDGRATLAVQWRLPQGRDYPYGRIVVQLDRETLLPLSIAMWNWDDELQAEYIYEDVKLNVGLGDSDFSLRACGL